jgi:hypothetical protein
MAYVNKFIRLHRYKRFVTLNDVKTASSNVIQTALVVYSTIVSYRPMDPMLPCTGT